MPMGTMTVTQGVNALNFVFQMNAYGGPNNVQYALGSQGGGDTIALQLNGINLSSITLSNVTATLWQNVSHNTGWVVDPTTQHEDGFGDWNFGINSDQSGGNPGNSFTFVSFTLNATGITLANIGAGVTQNTNCSNAGVLCYEAGHINQIDTTTGTSNWVTGYGGATKGETPVPEPGSLMLLGSGLAGAASYIRRRK